MPGGHVHAGGPHVHLHLNRLARGQRVAPVRPAAGGQAQHAVGEQDGGAVGQDLGEGGVQVRVDGVGAHPGAQPHRPQDGDRLGQGRPGEHGDVVARLDVALVVRPGALRRAHEHLAALRGDGVGGVVGPGGGADGGPRLVGREQGAAVGEPPDRLLGVRRRPGGQVDPAPGPHDVDAHRVAGQARGGRPVPQGRPPEVDRELAQPRLPRAAAGEGAPGQVPVEGQVRPRADDQALARPGRAVGHGAVVAQGAAQEQVVPACDVERGHVQGGQGPPGVGDRLPVGVVQRVGDPVGHVAAGRVRPRQSAGGLRHAHARQEGREVLHRLGQELLGRVLPPVVHQARAHLLARPLVRGSGQEHAPAHGQVLVVGGGGDPGGHRRQVLGGGQGRGELGGGQVGVAEGDDAPVAPGQVGQGPARGHAVGGLIGVEAEVAVGDVRAAAGLGDDGEALLDGPVQAHRRLHPQAGRREAGRGGVLAQVLGDHGAPGPEVGAAGQQDRVGGVVVGAHDVGPQDRAVGYRDRQDLVDGARGGAARLGHQELLVQLLGALGRGGVGGVSGVGHVGLLALLGGHCARGYGSGPVPAAVSNGSPSGAPRRTGGPVPGWGPDCCEATADRSRGDGPADPAPTGGPQPTRWWRPWPSSTGAAEPGSLTRALAPTGTTTSSSRRPPPSRRHAEAAQP